MTEQVRALAMENIGDTVTAAKIDYAAAVWRRWGPEETPAPPVAGEHLVGGTPITILLSTRGIFQNAGLVVLRGSLSVQDDGHRAFFPEAGQFTQPFPLTSPNVIELVEGHVSGAEFVTKYNAILASLPRLAPVTKADIDALPASTGSDDDTQTPIRLVLFGTRTSFGFDMPGCLWLFTERTDGDIVDGYGYLPAESGYESEYGSEYVRNVLGQRALVKVVNAGEGLTFREVVMGFDKLNDQEAYASVIAGKIVRAPRAAN